ncbi:MAG: thioredoxin family protein [Phycisphaerales bacterium]|nr:thioredoxin family protein [Phycisphaerales bacterium]
MARTPSTMRALGTPAPAFRLPDTTGAMVSNTDFEGRPLLVMFICNHCPFVKHIRGQLASLGRDYAGEIGVVAINSNDVEHYPDDSPEKMAIEVTEAGYVFPYLFDESQEVARAFEAACTPDFFLFDASHHLVYRGQLDDSRPGNGVEVTGTDLRAAIEAVIAGTVVPAAQQPSIGCNITWKA